MKNSPLKAAMGGAAAIGLSVLFSTQAWAGKTLDTIKQRDQMVCGVNTGLAGFGAADSQGKWTGLDVDVCRAVAAAVLGSGDKVRYVPLSAPQRFTALQSGEIDMLSRNTTFTLTRDASLGLHQTAVTFYDGQGFMVPVKAGIKNAKQLKGATVCVQSGTTTEKNLTDFSKRTTWASSQWCSKNSKLPMQPTLQVAARLTPPTPLVWRPSAPKRQKIRKSTPSCPS